VKLTKRNKKTLLKTLIACAVFLLIASFFTVAYRAHIWPFSKVATTLTQPQENASIDTPAQQEINSSQDGKKNSVDAGPAKTNVSVDIAYAGVNDEKQYVEIRAFTADVIEGDGVCVATLSQGGALVTGSAKAFVDASSSICAAITIPLSKFSTKGEWSVSVSYTSTSHSGVSDTESVVQL
jgi:hypothetical protein